MKMLKLQPCIPANFILKFDPLKWPTSDQPAHKQNEPKDPLRTNNEKALSRVRKFGAYL